MRTAWLLYREGAGCPSWCKATHQGPKLTKFLKLNIFARVMGVVAVALAATIVVTWLSIGDTASLRLNLRTEQLSSVVDAAYNIIGGYADQAKAGKMSDADAKAAATKALSSMRYGASGYVFVIDDQGISIVNPNNTAQIGQNTLGNVDGSGKHFTKDMIDGAKANGSGVEAYQYSKVPNGPAIDKISYYKYYQPWGWVIGSGVYLDDLAAANSANIQSQILRGGLVALLLVIVAYFITRTITVPINRMTKSMGQVAAGQYDVAIVGGNRGDEIGAMARAVEIFRANGMKVAEMTETEKAAVTARAAERTQMMQSLRSSFGDVVDAAADGDFSRRVTASFPDAELNALAESVNGLVTTVGRGLAESANVLAALAEQDLAQRVEGDYKGAFLQLKTDTNAVADKLTEIVGQLKHTSGSLKLATGEILSGANDLSERTTKQAATIEETSAAMEQLAQTVLQNAKRAGEASQVSASVTRTAEEGGDVMTAANEAMERITQSSAKISNIIGLIDDIAFQTNLLALNASVEAARAGEAGKGFAVVAVEVRRLAQSAAEASSEVKVLIEQSGVEVSGGSKLVADAAQKLTAMVAAARSSNELMDGIAKDSRQQASSIEEVSSAVRQMDEMTQHNAALVEEINAAIEQTESQANDLDKIVDVFTLDAAAAAAMAEPAPQQRSAAPSRSAAKPGGIKAMQEKVKQAAKSYLTRGNTAVKEDWSEF